MCHRLVLWLVHSMVWGLIAASVCWAFVQIQVPKERCSSLITHFLLGSNFPQFLFVLLIPHLVSLFPFCTFSQLHLLGYQSSYALSSLTIALYIYSLSSVKEHINRQHEGHSLHCSSGCCCRSGTKAGHAPVSCVEKFWTCSGSRILTVFAASRPSVRRLPKSLMPTFSTTLSPWSILRTSSTARVLPTIPKEHSPRPALTRPSTTT